MLPQCVGGLMRVARTVRMWRDGIRKRELEWERRKQERAELVRQIEEEEARVKELETSVRNWNKAQQIRAFVELFKRACNAKGIPTTPDDPKGKWLEWALKQADRFDPLVDSPPSVLDRKTEVEHWQIW